MSGLADFEKQGLFDFFNSVEDKTILIQISKSMTKSYMAVGTLEEALNIVFLYGGSTTNILNKKLITKEILFRYLHTYAMRVPKDFTKIGLVEQIQQFWKEKFSDSIEEKFPQQPLAIEENKINYPTNSNIYGQQQICTPNQTSLSATDPFRTAVGTATIPDSTSYPINLLAKKFSEWFFQSYNENKLIAEDFWIDTMLLLRMIDTSTGNIEEQQCNSSKETVDTLCSIKQTYTFVFNPNLTHEGVQGRLDAHGLVLVLCCGTLHTTDRCIGTFDSLFGLIRDPGSENNWKIKNLKFVLKSTAAIQQIPNLTNSDTLSELLCLPEPSGNL